MKFYVFFPDDLRVVIERPEHYCGWPVHDVAFVCPECLMVWCQIESADDKFYHIQAASCVNCKPSHKILNPIPGSLLDNSLFTNGPDWDLFDALPDFLKRREYDLHIAQFERYQNEHTPTSSSHNTATFSTLGS